MKPKISTPNSLDFVRLIFATLVVLSHFFVLSERKDLEYLSKIFNPNVAVMGFFIISGFLVSASYLHTPNLKEYFIKRARRLLPAYFSIVIFAILIGVFFSKISSIQFICNNLTYKYLIFNLGFANFLQPTLPGLFEAKSISVVNGSLWTIKVEVMFYMILPFFLFFVGKCKSLKSKNYFLFIFYFIFTSFNFILEYCFENNSFIKIYQHQLPSFMPFFFVGIIMYYNQDFLIKQINYVGILGLILFLEHFIFKTDFLWAFGLAGLIFFVAFRLKSLNKLLIFGDISYGLYLFHFIIIQLVFTELPNLNLALQLCIVLIISILLAYFSYHFVEKRFIKKY